MKASFSIYADHVRNLISPNLFGHFMEHAEDIIYDGIYAPDHIYADELGFRRDVCDAIRDSGASTLRYPGGNFVSNYHWEDGIGPRENRPRVFDYAWLTDDDNRIGTVEFIELCRKVNAEPYICVNMGSGTAEEAMHWVEFCNGTTNTKYANMRRQLGYEEPFAVKYWGLGNEMYGEWQFASSSAEDYAKKAKDFAKAMRCVDPSIILIAAGFDIDSNWNRTVANVLGPLINHIAIHHYSIGYDVFHAENYTECMYIPDYISKLTKACYSSIISGTNDALSSIKVAWDEWNTYAWDLPGCHNDHIYNLSNAILTASIIHTFIRHSDVVEIASYSPFINKCGAVRTADDGILKRTQYYVFEMLSQAFKINNQYLESYMDCQSRDLPEVIDFSNRFPEPKFALNDKPVRRIVHTPFIDGIAACNENKDLITVSLINKHETESCDVDLKLYGMQLKSQEATVLELYADDLYAANTSEQKDAVIPKVYKINLANGTITIPKHSLTVLTLSVQ